MIRFFCFVYGDAFLDLFEKIAVRSLTQTKNKAAIPAGAIVSLYTDLRSFSAAQEIASRLGLVEAHLIETNGDIADIQNRVFIFEVERCYRDNATMVIVNPDNFWGDGSLANLLAMAVEPKICIAAPHVRVDCDKFMEKLSQLRYGHANSDVNCFNGPELTNAELVGMSMKCLHSSWIDADATKSQTSSFYAGISIRKIAPELYSVSHRLPTCWLARFTEEDMLFFRRNPSGRGLWDHYWPEMLVRSERQRVIGSSDAFFIAELTEPDTHFVSLVDSDPEQADVYCRSSLHASVNRNVTAIWRAI